MTVLRKASSFEIGTNFMAWACGIVRLNVPENFRQNKRANVLSEKAIVALTEDVPSPESFKEREQALEKCIAKLPSNRGIFSGEGIPAGNPQMKWPKLWV